MIRRIPVNASEPAAVDPVIEYDEADVIDISIKYPHWADAVRLIKGKDTYEYNKKTKKLITTEFDGHRVTTFDLSQAYAISFHEQHVRVPKVRFEPATS